MRRMTKSITANSLFRGESLHHQSFVFQMLILAQTADISDYRARAAEI